MPFKRYSTGWKRLLNICRASRVRALQLLRRNCGGETTPGRMVTWHSYGIWISILKG